MSIFRVNTVSQTLSNLSKISHENESLSQKGFSRLLNILAKYSNLFCRQANSVDPDQTDLGPHCLQK